MSTIIPKDSPWNALSVPLLPVVIVFESYVAMKLWEWHVVPVTHWPVLSLGHAMGLVTLQGFIRDSAGSPKNDKGGLELSLDSLLMAAICLLVGWLAT